MVPRHLLDLTDPRPSVRRRKVAWRVGWLRTARPGLARDLVAEIGAGDATPAGAPQRVRP